MLFPGQASQYVGMGKELVDYKEAVDMFTKASEIVGYDILDVCLNGPIETLSSTDVCQVATVVCSIAALVKFRDENPFVSIQENVIQYYPTKTTLESVVPIAIATLEPDHDVVEW